MFRLTLTLGCSGDVYKVHILFWEGHIILRNLHLTLDWHYIGQK